MDTLPVEILTLVLKWAVRMSKCEKNDILPLRRVCKVFDVILKPYALKTLQLEFSRFLRHAPKPDPGSLLHAGAVCEAIYLDMMVVRDEEEIARLTYVFQSLIPKVPEMTPLLESLRRYCMNNKTFDETDYRRVVQDVLSFTPNVKKIKLNLPFQVVGQCSRTATLLLATSLACFAKRNEEHHILETLVLDHVSDTTLIDICYNPIDLSNTLDVLQGLKHLVLSIKRQEAIPHKQTTFAQNLSFLIQKAINLECLCLIGWNVKRDINSRKHCHNVSQNHWTMRSLPFLRNMSLNIGHIRCLELKRVDIFPQTFVDLIEQIAPSLKELYLNEIYLKVRDPETLQHPSYWIGHGRGRAEKACWVAEDLHNIEDLNLSILRVTGLGYDDFLSKPDARHPDYDLRDLSGLGRSFDQRFVEAVINGPEPFIEAMDIDQRVNHLPMFVSPDLVGAIPLSAIDLSIDPSNLQLQHQLHQPQSVTEAMRHKSEYDAETFQKTHNTTSFYKKCIDGCFFNHNEQALRELQNIITVADRGMVLLSEEIERARGDGGPTERFATGPPTAGR